MVEEVAEATRRNRLERTWSGTKFWGQGGGKGSNVDVRTRTDSIQLRKARIESNLRRLGAPGGDGIGQPIGKLLRKHEDWKG
ncbi:unnamed protein product [Arabis nemorensis]|uniref:Uncharacterized protein n=1 Tax=Arabis nemorensis TaxID=586526 RepID=A0A565BKD2_9BRAS|nr:unnamed protein product [Arabis nemorensis]